jgi:hypothetical protein
MLRPALALGLLFACSDLACGDGPPERHLRPPPGAPATPTDTPTATPTAPLPPPPPPDTPAARDLTAICLAATLLPGSMPPADRFARALEEAGAAVSSDSKPLVQRLQTRDLAERAVDLRQAAAAAGVLACPLADAMDVVAGAVPNQTDALALITVLEALVTVSPEYKDRILAAGCAELPACGRECSSGLAAAAAAEPTQRAFALMRECAAFRAQATTQPTDDAAFAWIRARVTAFADASADILPSAGAARLTELRTTLQL